MAMDPETARYLLELDDEIAKLWKTLESHTTADERAGSVFLNSSGRFVKWIFASIMPPPSLVPAR
jgi:hypothetical protein